MIAVVFLGVGDIRIGEALDRRDAGWIKVELVPAKAAE